MSFLALAPDVIDHIAFDLAVSEPLGPPSSLIPLRSTCRALRTYLHIDNNHHLYANIFCATNDTASLRRRFPAERLTAGNLAQELKRRCISLNRIRKYASGGEDWRPRAYKEAILKEDLLTAYLMLIESDGLNAMTLIRYANLPMFMQKYFFARLTPVHQGREMPVESDTASLAMNVEWLLTDFRRLLMEQDSRKINTMSTPYMLGSFFYRGSFAPWTIPSLPISEADSTSSMAPGPLSMPPQNPNPLDEQFTSRHFIADLTPRRLPITNLPEDFLYFGAPLAIAAPNICHAATMCYISRLQRRPMILDNEAPYPTDQELLGVVNIRERWHQQYSAGLSSLSTSVPLQAVHNINGMRSYTPHWLHVRFPTLARSESHDADFARLTTCYDPFKESMYKELGMPRYQWTKGSLAGEWDGRFILPEMGTYHSIMSGANALNTLEDTHIWQDPESWIISEHYHVPQFTSNYNGCTVINGPAMRAGPAEQAFIPSNARLERARAAHGQGIDVSDVRIRPDRAGITFYKTWTEGRRGNDVNAPPAPLELSDEEEGDGLIHIIISGRQIPRPEYIPARMQSMWTGEATILGTVRTWDGLITLRATDTFESWVWYGYLVGDGNFVGRWRDASMDTRRNAYEGPFVMRRRVPEV